MQVAPDGTILEQRWPLDDGTYDIMMAYEPDGEVWATTLSPMEAAKAFEDAV